MHRTAVHARLADTAYNHKVMSAQSKMSLSSSERKTAGFRARRAVGWLGVGLALSFFGWLLVGLIPGIPDMVDVFGVEGLRTPAGVAITGLLMGAIGFFEP